VFKTVDREKNRQKKHSRIRSRITGTSAKPRLSVFRSLDNIFVQLIDDVNGVTLASASTIDKELKTDVKNGGNKEAAAAVGKKIAERALAKDIKTIVFDRSGYIYNGRIQSLADAAREAGLEF
jgi:large subunit ribosomal protein L18